MAKRYELNAKGLSGVPYRIDIYDSTYSGSLSTVRGARQFVTFDGGEKDANNTHPLWPKEARMFVRGDADFTPLFGAADDQIRVEVVRTDDSSLVYKGYLLTDFYQDSPYAKDDLVELRSIGGIPLLKNVGFGSIAWSDALSGQDNTQISVRHAIQTLLGQIFSTDLDVEFAAEWYPYFEGNQIPAGELPLDHLYFNKDNYLNERPDGKGYLNAYEVLKDLLRTFELTLRQRERPGGDCAWHVRQRSAVDNDGTLKTWVYNSDGSIRSGYPKDVDLSLDLTSKKFSRGHSRSFERRWQTVNIVHDHVPIENVVADGGFEDNYEAWSFNPDLTVSGNVILHDNAGNGVDSTQENEQTLELVHKSDSADAEFPVTQSAGKLEGYPANTVGNFSFNMALASDSGPATLEAQVQIGDHYLHRYSTGVTSDALKGTGSIQVNAIARPIPEGAVLPIEDSNFNQVGTITLSERAAADTTELVGEITADVKDGYTVIHFGMEATESSVQLTELTDAPENWQKFDYRFSLRDADGNLVTGDTYVRLGSNTDSSDTPSGWIDDVKLSLLVNDSTLNQTTVTGRVAELGQDITVTTRLGDGPTNSNLSRILVENDGSVINDVDDWKIGAYSSGESPSGNSLSELHALQRLRYFRNHNQRLQLTFPIRDETPVISGDEVIKFDGESYTVSSIKHDPGRGRVTVGLLEINDRGTSGIDLDITVSNEGSTTGGSPGGASGGSSQSTNWGDLDGQLAGNVPFDESGPTERGLDFSNVSPNIQWLRDPSNNRALEVLDTSNGNDLLWLDESGNLHAKGEIQAFSDGSGSSSTTNSQLQILDDGSSETMDAKSLNIQGASVTESNGDVTLDLTGLGGGGTDFQAGNLLSLDTSTSPDTLNVHSEVPRMDLDETVTGQWTFDDGNNTPVQINSSDSNWRLVASDTWSSFEYDGFVLNDETNDTNPVVIQSGAPSRALHIKANGRTNINTEGISDGDTFFALYGHRPLKFTRRGSEASNADISIESAANNRINFRGNNNNVTLDLNVSEQCVGVGKKTSTNFRLETKGDVDGKIGGVEVIQPSVAAGSIGDWPFGAAAIQLKRKTSRDQSGMLIGWRNGSGDFWMGANADYWKLFNNNQNTVVRVAQNGTMNVGTSNHINKSSMGISVSNRGAVVKDDNSNYGLWGVFRSDGTRGGYLGWGNGDDEIFLWADNASMYKCNVDFLCQGEVEAYDSSDIRLKENLTVVDNPLEKILQLNGYYHDWNEEAPKYKPESGYALVAQEVQEVAPEMVRKNGDGYLGLQYEQLHAFEIEAIKELKKENERLREELNELKDEII